MQAALASHKGSGRALYPTHISLERLSVQSWSHKSLVSIRHCGSVWAGLGCMGEPEGPADCFPWSLFFSSCCQTHPPLGSRTLCTP